MRTIISGSNHFIIPKKIVFTAFMVGLGAFFGMYLSEHLHAKRTETFLKKKNESVKDANEKLIKEKSAYQSIFDELKDHLADWEKGRDMSLTEQAEHVTSFHDQAQQLMQGLQDMQDLLEEKEFQLWEKEGLLEYQEERLMNTEDLEMEMAGYINDMATSLQTLNATLPDGLEQQPYFGQQFGTTDDDPDAASVYEEEGTSGSGVRRRRLRAERDDAARMAARARVGGALAAAARRAAPALGHAAAGRAKAAVAAGASRNGAATGAYRAHLLETEAPPSA